MQYNEQNVFSMSFRSDFSEFNDVDAVFVNALRTTKIKIKILII